MENKTNPHYNYNDIQVSDEEDEAWEELMSRKYRNGLFEEDQ